MRLFIAEKPSLGQAIADGLGSGKKCGGYIDCGEDIVTWCFGHLFELCNPEDYDPSWASWSVVPVVPASWRVKPKESSIDQVDVIGGLLRRADLVVNAGDPDREGQLLVDEVLEHFGYQGMVERIWLASLDARSVARALADLADNGKYAPLRDAARARSQADWLIGMNATRALTNMGRDAGIFDTLSLGRVQTPVLNLVVTRDREIAAFKPQDYMILQGRFAHPAGEFLTKFIPGELQAGLDAQGRLVDPAAAEAVIRKVRGQQGNIAAVTRENRQKAPPLPYCLSSLQKAAFARWGMTAQQVLDTAQRLYEKKLTTYPRSDCSYLPMEQWDDAGRILAALSSVSGLEDAAQGADAKMKSSAWNTGKITAHHAIIPTGEIPDDLSESERNLYSMIALAYIIQFYPAMRYVSQKIRVNVADTFWEAAGRHVTDPGWTKVTREEEEEPVEKEQDQALPAVAQNDAVTCADVGTLKKKTSPPPRFTEGSLIEAMANIHRFVEDAAAKATLRDNEGIGTEATRAGILETLKKRKYLTSQGKALVSTRLAGQVIDLTPQGLKDPVTTARWESRLQAIAEGKESLEAFMTDQVQLLPELLEPLLSGQTVIKVDGPVFSCPACGKPLQKKKNEKGTYWCCFRKELHKDGVPVFLPDDRGRPGAKHAEPELTEIPCEKCGTSLQHLKGNRKDGSSYDFFKCPDCGASFNNVNGKPVAREAPKNSGFVCPACGKPLRLFERVSKRTGKPFKVFNCSGYPACKASFFEKAGKPDFSQK